MTLDTGNLRDYQERAVQDILAAVAAGAQSVLLIAPTGSGKTRMISAAVARMGRQCVSYAHRREIVRQIADAMQAASVAVHDAMGVTSARALRAANSSRFDTLFVDEAHHIAAPSYLQLLKAGRNKLILGATATPYRADGAKIGPLFDAVVATESARCLADAGYLAQVSYVAASDVDFAGIKKNIKKDFDATEALERVRISVQAGDVVQSWTDHAHGAPALVYCINQQHCELVREELTEAGKTAAVVTARTRPTERRALIAAFEARELDALINCEIFTEGTDIRGVQTLIMLRPTLSRALYKQMIGRGLRPDVDCIVIDHVGNHARHGDVLNEDVLDTMSRQGAVRDTDAAGRALEVRVGRMAMHIARVEAQLSRIWVPSVFRQGAA